VKNVFKSVPRLDEKCVELHLGVDTSQFDPVPRDRRRERIDAIEAALKGKKRGKSREQSEAMFSRLSGALDQEELRQICVEAERYDGKAPDAGAEEKLATIEWATSPTLLFAGRIISMKGVQSVLAALPLILERVPDLQLIVVGHGPLREPMEAFVWGLEHGDRALVEKIVAWGKALEEVSERMEAAALAKAVPAAKVKLSKERPAAKVKVAQSKADKSQSKADKSQSKADKSQSKADKSQSKAAQSKPAKSKPAAASAPKKAKPQKRAAAKSARKPAQRPSAKTAKTAKAAKRGAAKSKSAKRKAPANKRAVTKTKVAVKSKKKSAPARKPARRKK